MPDFGSGEAPPPQTVPGLEIAGFLISPETEKDLESLDLRALPRMQGRRIMVLSRADLLPDAKLVSVFEESGGAVEVSAGSGYAAMMEGPHDAIPPAATGTVIVEFLQRDWQVRPSESAGGPGGESVLTESAGKRTAAIEEAGAHVLETVCTFGSSPASAFGLIS